MEMLGVVCCGLLVELKNRETAGLDKYQMRANCTINSGIIGDQFNPSYPLHQELD